MKCTPLRHHQIPRYPTKLEVLADRTLLQPHLSAPWLRRSEVAAGLALAIAASQGCYSVSEGCMTVLPPVYLSEERALQIIIDEAKKNGLSLSTDEAALAEIVLPFKVDVADPEHQVAIEYVSHEDCMAFYAAQGRDAGVEDAGIEDTGVGSDVARPYRGECEYSNEEVFNSFSRQAYEAQPELQVRVLDSWFLGSEAGAEAALRQEVVEFVDYLRSIGVI